jgi:hypothetical protein
LAPDTPDDLPKSESTPDLASATPGGPASASNNRNNNNNNNTRRRFAPGFHFRKRSNNRSVSGPALAVVDADPQPVTTQESNNNPAVAVGNKKDTNKTEKEDEGVRVIIRLAALDEQGTELASPNEQTTFLHIVRLGPPSEDPDAEDNRPWVVKVAKREATIGPHTFQLHEIYGLTSAAATSTSPANNTTATSPVPSSPPITDAHTYPPTQQSAAGGEDPSSECLLCLSSPREVVLIPCRHLVACKECALNMVEFGAGGNITHNITEPAPAAVASVTTGGATGTGAGNTDTVDVSNSGATAVEGANVTGGGTTITNPVATLTTRRKRKAKGWFCPVCRQRTFLTLYSHSLTDF